MEDEDPLVVALRAFCKTHGGHDAVAQEIGANSQAIYQVVSRVKLPSGRARGVGRVLRERLDSKFPNWRNAGKSPIEINLDANPDYPAIKRVNFRLSAGISGFAVDVIDDPAAPIVYRRDWYEHRHLDPAKLFAVRVLNGSMESGLFDGDLVVVNTESTTPKDGKVFAVNYEGELVIKRLVRDRGQWWLSSDNPDKAKYPRKLCDDRTFIIGEIVHKQSEKI